MLIGSQGDLYDIRSLVKWRTFANNIFIAFVSLCLTFVGFEFSQRLRSTNEHRQYLYIGCAFACQVVTNILVPVKELKGLPERFPLSTILFLLSTGYTFFYLRTTDTVLNQTLAPGNKRDTWADKDIAYKTSVIVILLGAALYTVLSLVEYYKPAFGIATSLIEVVRRVFELAIDDGVALVFLLLAARGKAKSSEARWLLVPAVINFFCDWTVALWPMTHRGFEFQQFPNRADLNIGWSEVGPMFASVTILIIVYIHALDALSAQNRYPNQP